GVSPYVRPVGSAVVREDTRDGDVALVEPLDGPAEDSGGGQGGLVAMDFGVGDTGEIVDDGVDVCLAHQRVAIFVAVLAGCGGSILFALPAADVAPASPLRDVAELLHVDVDHGAGVGVLVTANGFAGGAIDVRVPVQVHAGQDLLNCRRRDAESAGQLHGSLAKSEAQGDATAHGLVVGLVRRVMWTGGTILHRLTVPVAVGPSFGGGPGDLEACSDLADWPTVFDNQLGHDQSVAGREGGIHVRHKGAFLVMKPPKEDKRPMGRSMELRLRSNTGVWSCCADRNIIRCGFEGP